MSDGWQLQYMESKGNHYHHEWIDADVPVGADVFDPKAYRWRHTNGHTLPVQTDDKGRLLGPVDECDHEWKYAPHHKIKFDAPTRTKPVKTEKCVKCGAKQRDGSIEFQKQPSKVTAGAPTDANIAKDINRSLERVAFPRYMWMPSKQVRLDEAEAQDALDGLSRALQLGRAKDAFEPEQILDTFGVPEDVREKSREDEPQSIPVYPNNKVEFLHLSMDVDPEYEQRKQERAATRTQLVDGLPGDWKRTVMSKWEMPFADDRYFAYVEVGPDSAYGSVMIRSSHSATVPHSSVRAEGGDDFVLRCAEKLAPKVAVIRPFAEQMREMWEEF